MNKGIALAKGDVIGFLHADDFYAGPRVLARVAAVFADPAVACAYGDLVFVKTSPGAMNGREDALQLRNGEFFLPDERVVRRWKAGELSARSFHWGWMPPHPTFFARRAVYDRLGVFRLDLGTAADYEFMLRCLLKQRLIARYIPEVMVKMRTGGASNASLKNRLAANRNDRKAWKVNGLRPYPWTLWLKPLRKVGQWR